MVTSIRYRIKHCQERLSRYLLVKHGHPHFTSCGLLIACSYFHYFRGAGRGSITVFEIDFLVAGSRSGARGRGLLVVCMVFVWYLGAVLYVSVFWEVLNTSEFCIACFVYYVDMLTDRWVSIHKKLCTYK